MKMDTEAFLKEISKRPPMWMSRHRQYKLKKVNKRLWEEIQQLFPGYEVDQLKKKWKNLKDAYRKELKKYPTAGDPGTDIDLTSAWKYFDKMHFLKEEIMPTENEPSRSENENHDLNSPRSTPSRAHETQTFDSEKPHSSRRRLHVADIRAEYLEIEKKKLKILVEEVAKQNNSVQNTDGIEKTEDYHFLMSLLPEMEKFTSIQKFRVRNKINQVVMEEMAMNTYGDRNCAVCGTYTKPSPSHSVDVTETKVLNFH